MTTNEMIVAKAVDEQKTTVLDNWVWRFINAVLVGACLLLSTGSLFGLWSTGVFPWVNYLLAAMALVPLADYISHKMSMGLIGAIMALILIYAFVVGITLAALKLLQA